MIPVHSISYQLYSVHCFFPDLLMIINVLSVNQWFYSEFFNAKNLFS